MRAARACVLPAPQCGPAVAKPAGLRFCEGLSVQTLQLTDNCGCPLSSGTTLTPTLSNGTPPSRTKTPPVAAHATPPPTYMQATQLQRLRACLCSACAAQSMHGYPNHERLQTTRGMRAVQDGKLFTLHPPQCSASQNACMTPPQNTQASTCCCAEGQSTSPGPKGNRPKKHASNKGATHGDTHMMYSRQSLHQCMFQETGVARQGSQHGAAAGAALAPATGLYIHPEDLLELSRAPPLHLRLVQDHQLHAALWRLLQQQGVNSAASQ